MDYFADTSALIKFFVDEVGSTWMRSLLDPATSNTVSIAKITIAEMDSALARRAREGTISISERDQTQKKFLAAVRSEYSTINLTINVLLRTRKVLNAHALRAADAIQLASALRANTQLINAGNSPIVFLSADDHLLFAAANEGLQADNPNRHP
jgi:predicted nucleic acid-binding protein